MAKPGTYDRKIKIDDMVGADGRPYSPDAFKGLEEQFEVRLRPRDGMPVASITDEDMAKHLLLTDRKTGKQFRVKGEKRAGHVMGVGMVTPDGKARPDDINLELYEVFEGEKYAPKYEVKGDTLNEVWKEVWRRPALSPYRDLLRRAVPFNLDDRAVEMVTELAMVPDKVGLYRQLARLPYDVVWIELDHLVQIKHQRANGSNRGAYLKGQEGSRIGYLIEKIGDTRWRMTYWGQFEVTPENVATLRRTTANGKLQPGDITVDTLPPHFIVDTERDVRDYITRVKDPSLRAAAQTICMEGNLGGIGWGLQSEDGPPGRFGLRKDMFMAATVDLPPDWEHGLLNSRPRPHSRRDGFVSLMQDGTKELAGLLRHVCAALALINEVPLGLKEFHTKGAVKGDGRLRPFKVNRTVTIALPKRSITPKKVMALFRGAKRRMARHQVRGHWRRYWIGSNKTGDRQMIRKWVDHFERGDSALGYVLHDYEVTA